MGVLASHANNPVELAGFDATNADRRAELLAFLSRACKTHQGGSGAVCREDDGRAVDDVKLSRSSSSSSGGSSEGVMSVSCLEQTHICWDSLSYSLRLVDILSQVGSSHAS